MGTLADWHVIIVAFMLDIIIGDPLSLPHPVRWMGNAICFFEPHFRKIPGTLIFSGGLFAVFLVSLSWTLSFITIKCFSYVSPFCGNIVEIIIVFYCISTKSLYRAAMDVQNALVDSDIKTARARLSMIVGRDVQKLDETGIARAAVETVAENFVDGVVSPLFYAAMGGAPLAVAFKMINTLDSMVGYKNERYLEFGRISARIDDVANYIPARLSIPVISIAALLLNRNGLSALKTALKEGSSHTSPNSGLSEAAFAGAFGIRLGGPNYYQDKLVDKPFIGTGFKDPGEEHIRGACVLMWLSSFIYLGVLCLII